MKSIISIIFSFICVSTTFAQYYYNPYFNPYAAQQAYEYGQQVARQLQQQQDEQDSRTEYGCINRIGRAIAGEDFAEAEEWAIQLRSLNEGYGYYYEGLANELQGYDSYAKSCYSEGADLGNKACQTELERIAEYGYATEEQIENIVAYFQQLQTMSNYMAMQITNDVWGNDSGNSTYKSNSSSSSCPKCHGSGIDPFPAALDDPYTGANIAAQGLVGYTHSSGNRCNYCGKYEYHIHYKCQSSTYHPY